MSTRSVARLFYLLLGASTLAGSLIWGIDALMLKDAGLSGSGIFAVNAAYMVGALLAEIPTGVIADTKGRRFSFLAGCASLAANTALYISLWYFGGALWLWLATSALLGVSYSFFTGALEAWLVDAYRHLGRSDAIQLVLGRGQAVMGAAMLVGAVLGGVLAQVVDFGAAYLVRVALLILATGVAFVLMRDIGFKPEQGSSLSMHKMTVLVRKSVSLSLGKPAVRWIVLGSPLIMSVNYYVFFVLQGPFLLELSGKTEAYSLAGFIAALTACAHMVGGIAAPKISALFRGRIHAVVAATAISCLSLIALGMVHSFWLGALLCGSWAVMRALSAPPRQAYLNEQIPTAERATVLSFDSMLGNAGAVPLMPILGKASDMYGYGAAMAVGGCIQLLAIPIIWRARRYDAASKASS